tara:strand:+ start:3687 stop:4265 length:579 start_codon:yes stop_codon:yes gene_type:complete
MAYQTYTTEALVCGTFDKNTADRSYLLLTKRAGMVFADARSVRSEKSRQRYALQDFSRVRVSLVKGKAGWKIGSIEAVNNYYAKAVDKTARGSVVSTVRFLRRFLKGEGELPELFDYVTKVLNFLSNEIEDRQFMEVATQVYILSMLGYVDLKKLPAEVQTAELSSVALAYSVQLHNKLDSLHEQALQVSHL